MDKLLELKPPTWDGPPGWLWDSNEIIPPLPRALLPKTLDDFAFSAPLLYDPTALGYSCLTVCAMAASDNIQLEINPGWHERACLWTDIAGPVGSGKTTVTKTATQPLMAIAAEQHEEHLSKLAAWKSKHADDEAEPEPPPRLITNDANSASLIKVLTKTEHGIGIYNDELSTLIASLDNARDPKSGPERGSMNALYDGGPNHEDRVGRGYSFVRNWSASLLGGVVTAKLLAIFKNSVSDGMLARCSIVFAAALPPSTSLESGDQARYIDYKDLIRRLVKHRPSTRVTVRLDEQARELLGEAKHRWKILVHDTEKDLPRYAERVNRLPALAARVALLIMIVEACESMERTVKHGAQGETAPRWADITSDQMQRAIALLDVQTKHDLAFYRMERSVRPGVLLAYQVSRFIMTQHVESFNQRAVTRGCDAWGNARADAKIDALRYLCDQNWIATTDDEWELFGKLIHGVKWLVNPEAHALYAEQVPIMRRQLAAAFEKIGKDSAPRREAKARKGRK